MEKTDYWQSFLRPIENLPQETQTELQVRAKNWMKVLFMGFQKRLVGTFKTIAKIEPFELPQFFVKTPTIEKFKKPFFKTDDVSLALLENQVRGVIAAFENSEKGSTDKFWIRVYNYEIGGNFKFRELALGVLKMLCLPISNAEVERSFSAVSYIKCWRRNRMDTETLVAILRCRFGLLWLKTKAGKFKPPNELLNYDSAIYDKL